MKKYWFLLLVFSSIVASEKPQNLSEAVRYGTVEQVCEFLWLRSSPNDCDQNGRTAMHYAV